MAYTQNVGGYVTAKLQKDNYSSWGKKKDDAEYWRNRRSLKFSNLFASLQIHVRSHQYWKYTNN